MNIFTDLGILYVSLNHITGGGSAPATLNGRPASIDYDRIAAPIDYGVDFGYIRIKSVVIDGTRHTINKLKAMY